MSEELNALIAQAEGGDVSAMNQLGHFYMIHHEVENLIMDGFLELTDSFTNKLRQHPLPQGWQWVNRENLEEKTLNSCVAAFRECIQANIQVAKKVIESGSGERLVSFISDTLIIELTYFIKKISTTLNETLNGVQWATFNAPKESSFANMAQAVMDFVQENLKISHEMDEMKNYEMAFYWHKKAAECGNINSVVHLGECYLEGIGAEQNIDLAIKMLEKAANQGDVWSMNKLTYIYGELDGYINQEQAAKWFLELIKRDCDPNSDVYENTGYNKDLYMKIKNAILNSKTEEEMMASLTGGSSGGSLLGGAFSITTSDAKSYINQAEEAIQRNIEYKEEQRRKAAEEEARKRAEEERARREAEERARREREERERQERERRENEERARREAEEKARREREIRRFYYKKDDGSIEWIPVDYSYLGITFEELTQFFNENSSEFHNTEEIVSLFQEAHNVKEKIEKGWRKNQILGTYQSPFEQQKGKFIIPMGTTRIGIGAFHGCNGLTSIIIPSTVTSIGYSSFAYSQSLISIEIPDSVKIIEKQAFQCCTKLTSVKVGKGVTSIEENAFLGCHSLTSVDLPDNDIKMGRSVFYGCDKLYAKR